MSQISPDPVLQKSPSDGSTAGDDQLGRLYKMSRTAGLGSNEYVAVNGVAVAALLFGVASVLVVFDPIFSIVPIAAIILAVLALVQVRSSAGTQAGQGLAALAIVAAIGFSALLGSQRIMEAIAHSRDKAHINAIVETFGKDVAAGNLDDAYACMSEKFMARLTRQAFIDRMNLIQSNANYGKIISMTSNGLVQFDVDVRTNQTLASSIALISLGQNRMDREGVTFRKRGSDWLIDDIATIFPSAPPPGSPAAGKTAR